ncbi:MAG: FAD-dependent oxidoreductase [Myxococcales bacterium]|nr:FAD-dependent oxidoreductase [Myxococcales bacterium]
MTRPSVAIVGAGVAGLGAARALAGRADVTVLEAGARAGGHVYTVDVDGAAVDMGFIVFSRPSYPRFSALLDELGLASRATAMSFSVALPDGDGRFEWSSASPAGWFAQPRNLVSARHWRFLAEVVRLLRVGRADLGSARTRRATLDEWLRDRRVVADVRDRFVVPLASALWSLAPDRCGSFPAETYLRFMDHHGMLRATRPHAWRTVVGGRAAYVRALLAQGRFAVTTDAAVTAIHRDPTGVTVVAAGRERRFDRVVLATSAEAAVGLLATPTADEARWLGPLTTSENRTVLHSDASVMPRARRAWASWNYTAGGARARVTYWMNRLQGLPAAPTYLVTLNPDRPLTSVHHVATFRHPQFDFAAIDAHAALPRLQGVARTYFAGAWTGFGFHEDGLRSGQLAAARLLADEGA